MFENNLLKASPVCIFNFHELSRNCLAMKILYECVKKVDDKSKILPRESFYKIYYILCQKLFERYPEISRSTCLPQSHILGQSKIGILTKLVHPDLVSKRIGKRGQSKASYIGLTLNYCVVNDEVKGLLHLDLPEIRAYFSKLNEPIQDPKRRRRSNREEVIKPKDLTGQFTSMPLLKPTKPLYSFVDLSCKYPGCDCSPRDWNISPNLVPKQSDWAQNRTNNSLQVLEGHGVNMNPLIDHISKGLFFVNEHSGISATIMHSINQLLDGSSSKETFLHFYIVVILVVFPAIIASDHEVSSSSKIRLRASVKDCVMKLEGKVENSSCVDKIGLKTFTGLLTKMIHINEMTSASIELCHSVGVLKEMAGDVSSLIGTVPGYSESSVFEQISMNQFIKSLKAYEYELPDTSNSESKGLSLATIHNIGNCYMEASRMITREMQQIPICPDGGKLASDIPFQVFRISAKILHTVSLLSADVLQLPIRIITIIMTHHPHVLQNTSFERFSKCDPDLSKETFKSWWVYSSMFQEYMSVMSEVVALSQKLAQT
ncbi:hypothetical protein JCM33374_g4604 [Metschnikowia sp. JCM 33374]|nr:hypothetical protein JCM33374_g4604 [Metschnikowia sp. JCM 33374]